MALANLMSFFGCTNWNERVDASIRSYLRDPQKLGPMINCWLPESLQERSYDGAIVLSELNIRQIRIL